jgi:hypothetical protein
MNTLFASIMTVGLDSLLPGLPYLILYIQEIVMIHGVQFNIKLRSDPVNVFKILPPEFSTCFTDSQKSRINNEQLFVNLSYWGKTDSGDPIIQIRNAAMPMPTYSEILAAGAIGN